MSLLYDPVLTQPQRDWVMWVVGLLAGIVLACGVAALALVLFGPLWMAILCALLGGVTILGLGGIRALTRRD